jgi:membrane-bound serine protease (ClpP class)
MFCALHATGQVKKIMTLEIKAEIDPRMTRHVALGLKHAEEIHADIVIIEMDTYGGVLTDARDIADQILKFKKPVWVFINSDAASAGALISIACDSIYMSTAANIGAATVVDGDGQKAPDKYQSYMRSIMRSTAEANHRDPRIAEGMVDESLTIPGIKKEGQIVTFSTSEAIQHGYCEGKAESINEILTLTNSNDSTLEAYTPSAVDNIVSFFLNPFLSGVLILIILAGIYFEMQAPGIGFAGFAALIALILYLVPYYLNGLAANWEIIALFIGFALIAAEIFVIPGFGVAGVSGLVLTIGSLVLIMINNDAFDFEFVRMSDLLMALTTSLAGVLGGVILLFVAGANLTNTRFFAKVALTQTQDSAQGFTANFNREPMQGKKGIAHTVLRPSGKVQIDEKVYDAFSRGEYIEKGEAIEVVDDETTALKVKRTDTTS